jgi:CRP-like cAMP-binding protein
MQFPANEAPLGARSAAHPRPLQDQPVPVSECGHLATLDVVLRRYSSLARLDAGDIELIRSLRHGQTTVPAGHELESEGMAARAPGLVLAGWACHYRMLSDGRRMILRFLVPGDAIALHARRRAPLASTAAVTTCKLADATPLWRAVHAPECANTALARAHQAVELQDETYLIDHLVRLGRQSAIERVCHLFLELHWRLQAVGLAHARAFPMPLTQEALADALGLSVVHLNRTLQRLRRDRIIACERARVVLLQPERMVSIAEYTPPRALSFNDHAPPFATVITGEVRT